MKLLSLKLQDQIFEDVEKMVKKVHISRNAYINEALRIYNQFNRKRILRKQIHRASKLVTQDSMEVLREMEHLDPHLLE